MIKEHRVYLKKANENIWSINKDTGSQLQDNFSVNELLLQVQSTSKNPRESIHSYILHKGYIGSNEKKKPFPHKKL